MKYTEIWGTLNIEATKDIAAITLAYRTLLKVNSPEDNPEGFMRLRRAYEEAQRYAKKIEYNLNQEDDEIDEVDEIEDGAEDVSEEINARPYRHLSPLEQWIKEVDLVYQDMTQRRQVSSWELLFAHDACSSLDQTFQAREYLLKYCMNHTFLPREIWRKIDQEFHIRESRDLIYEDFEEGYIDYVIRTIESESIFDYFLFKPILGENLDQYLMIYYQIKECLDTGSTEGCAERLEQLRTYQSYHPYLDAEQARYHMIAGQIEKADQLMEELGHQYPEDNYILIIYAQVKYQQQEYDKALVVYQRVLERLPYHYGIRKSIMECYEQLGLYQEAKDMGLIILDVYPQDNQLSQKIYEYNNVLISLYEEKLHHLDYNVMLELAWCYYQNHKYEEALSFMKKIPTQYHESYDYINLIGRIYFQVKEYGIAIDKVRYWIATIEKTPTEDEEEYNKRNNRLGFAYSLMGKSYLELKDYNKAIEYLEKAIAIEKNIYNKLTYMERLSFLNLELKDYGKTVDIATKILEISPNFYPALLHRQEANYELNKDYDVIQDYNRATEVAPMGIKPYLLAMKVYTRRKMLEEAEKIAERVKELKIISNEFELMQIRVFRRKEASLSMIEQVEKACNRLKLRLNDPSNDITDPGSIDYQRVLSYLDMKLYDKAIAILDNIIRNHPDNYYYQYVKGILYKDLGKIKEMVDIFKKLIDHNYQKEDMLYELGCGYKKLNSSELGIPYLKQYLTINPNHYDTVEILVDIYKEDYVQKHNIADFEQAIHYANLLVELKPNLYSYQCRGNIYMNARQFSKALEDYEKGLEYNSDDWVNWSNMGNIYLMERKLDLSAKYLDKAISLVSMDEETKPYTDRAFLYFVQRDYDKAIQIYQELYRKNMESQRAIHRLIESYLAKRDILGCKEWLSKLDKNNMYYRYLGMVYLLEDNMDQAIKSNKKACVIKRDRAAVDSYCSLLLLNGKVEKAVSSIRKSIKPILSDTIRYSELILEYAILLWSIPFYTSDMKQKNKYMEYRKLGREFADLSMEHLYKVCTDEADYLSNVTYKQFRLLYRAYYNVIMGNLDRAKELLKEILETEYHPLYMYESHVGVYELYALLSLEAGDYESAKHYYEEVLRYNPASKLTELKLQKLMEKV